MCYPSQTLIEDGLLVVSKLGSLLVLSRRDAAYYGVAASGLGCGDVSLAEDYLGCFSRCLNELLMGDSQRVIREGGDDVLVGQFFH